MSTYRPSYTSRMLYVCTLVRKSSAYLHINHVTPKRYGQPLGIIE